MPNNSGIERTLGKIEAGIDFLKESHLESRKDVNDIKNKLSSGEGKISLLKEKVNEMEEHLDNQSTETKLNTKFREEVRTKIAVYGTVAGSIIGVIVFVGDKIIGRIFGGN